MKCRPATKEDMVEYYGDLLPNISMKVSVLVHGDKVVGVGGVTFSKIPMAFMDIKTDADKINGYKRTLVKACGEMMSYIRKNHDFVIVMRENHALSCGLLMHYGFKKFDYFNGYDMYFWKKK